MNEYEWIFEDTRLVIYDWFTMTKLYGVYTQRHQIFLNFDEQDKLMDALREDAFAVVYVNDIPRTYKNRYHRSYWVLSFKSARHAFIFKLKYGAAL